MANRRAHYQSPSIGDPTDRAAISLLDELDGSFSEAVRARLEGWDGTGWIKTAVTTDGYLQVAGSASTAPASSNVNIISSITLPVSGTVAVAGSTVPVTIAGTLPVSISATSVTQPVSGSVSIAGTTLPITGSVSIAASTVPITDNGGSITVDIGATSVTQPVSGTISIASSTVPVSQNGAWTVQPGNTANTTAWKVDASATTVPVNVANASLAITQPVASALNATVSLNGMAGARAAVAVSVTTGATALPASVLANRKTITVYNNGAVTVYLGGSGVTVAAGTPLAAGGSYVEDSAVALYGIVASGTCDVRVMEVS